MKLLTTTLLLLTISISWCQNSPLWGDLNKGNYSVGIIDTMIYNQSQTFTYDTYEGHKPYFVSIWYPKEADHQNESRVYGDYFDFEVVTSLAPLRDSLMQMEKSALIEYGIKNRLDSWDDGEYGPSEKELLELLLKTEVNAKASKNLPQKQFPVIVNHHGMGGSRHENFVLFEYLSSHGFIVVSSNYHWPDQSRDLNDLKDDLSFVAKFASELSCADDSQIHFLGHSWGSQIGLICNQSGNHPFKSFILLDNTLEQLSLQQVGRYYPHLDSIFRNHSNDFKTKSYIMTSQKAYKEEGELVIAPDPQFESFKLLNLDQFEFLITKETLSHEGFTSVGVIRSIYTDQITQDDAGAVNSQFATYLELNRRILKLLKNVEVGNDGFLKRVTLKN